jgi:hypothetical protein
VLVIAIAACVLLALIAVRDARAAAQAWLSAYLFWAGLPLGALFLVLAHGMTGGDWGLTLRPALFAMLRLMPLLALFLVPVLIGLRDIYPWAAAGGHGWLAPPFFGLRAALYVILWNVIAAGAMRRQRPGGELSPGFAWPALILLFASTTLAAFDWFMTLEPGWTSTIYGMLVTAGWAVSAAAAGLALTAAMTPSDAIALDAPARILLALICLWAYLSIIQLIVIWESDLSREIPWYLRRVAGDWRWVALAIAILEFALPFFVLIWQPLRRWRATLLLAAGSALIGHLAEIWWLTLPDFGRVLGGADLLALIGIGAAFVFGGGRDPALPLMGPGDARR